MFYKKFQIPEAPAGNMLDGEVLKTNHVRIVLVPKSERKVREETPRVSCPVLKQGHM